MKKQSECCHLTMVWQAHLEVTLYHMSVKCLADCILALLNWYVHTVSWLAQLLEYLLRLRMINAHHHQNQMKVGQTRLGKCCTNVIQRGLGSCISTISQHHQLKSCLLSCKEEREPSVSGILPVNFLWFKLITVTFVFTPGMPYLKGKHSIPSHSHPYVTLPFHPICEPHSSCISCNACWVGFNCAQFANENNVAKIKQKTARELRIVGGNIPIFTHLAINIFLF